MLPADAGELLEGAGRGRAALGRFAGALLPSGQQLHLALDDVGPAAVHVEVDEERTSFQFRPSHVDDDRPSFGLKPSQVDEERPSFPGSLSDADDDRLSFKCRLSDMAKNWRTFGDGASASLERPGFDFQPIYLDEDRPSFDFQPSHLDEDRPSFDFQPRHLDEGHPGSLGSPSDADDDRPTFICQLSHMAERRHTFGDGGQAHLRSAPASTPSRVVWMRTAPASRKV